MSSPPALKLEPEGSALRRYGLAVLVVVAATLLRWLIRGLLDQNVPFLLYLPAILLAGRIGGLGPALLATALSSLAAQTFFVQPTLSSDPVRINLIWQGLFILVGVFIAVLVEELHRSRRRITASVLASLRSEQEARESEERFRIMADSAPVLVWMSGVDGLCDWVNKPWLDFTGRKMDEVLGRGWSEQIHPDDRERCRETYSTAFDARRPFSMEYRLRRHDGEHRWVLDEGVPRFSPGGTFEGYIGSCLDIHGRKKAEEERSQLLEEARLAWREAEAASRSKDDFLATVSHELRTPLNAILGWTQILQISQDPEKTARGLQVIARNARAQAQLIDDLLDVSRIISGKMRLDVRSVDLSAIIDAAIESVRPAAEARQIRLVRLLDPLAGPIAGDADRLQQVVWNLLSNAVKFTPKGGTVEVRLERVDSHVEILVADTGAGISPDFLPHVFDRFRQFDSSTTRAQGGLGLGLAIVRHLTELHGGTVQVRSPGEGKGSTFSVRLPLSIAQVETSEPRIHPRVDRGEDACRDNPELNLKGVRVLVVDDEPDARETLAQILEHCDGEVLAVDSADAAMRALEKFQPHVLLSDIGMPGEDGYTLIRRVRELPPERGGRVPAAALTAFARSEDRRRALLAGFQMHIAKPVDINELAAVVATLARGTGAQ